MSTDTTTPDASNPTSGDPAASPGEPGKSGRSCRGGRRRRHWRKGLFAASLLALAVFAIPRAFAHSWGGGGCDHDSASWTAAGVREHMGWVGDRLVDHADGTGEQQKKVDAILDGVAPDVVAFHGEAQDLRADLRTALTAPTVSRDALEVVRKDGLDLADRASARAMDALADLAAVFTPDQRQKLAKEWADRHGDDKNEK